MLSESEFQTKGSATEKAHVQRPDGVVWLRKSSAGRSERRQWWDIRGRLTEIK